MNQSTRLRELPAVNSVLTSLPIEPLRKQYPDTTLVGWIRQSLEKVRRSLQSEKLGATGDIKGEVIRQVLQHQHEIAGNSVKQVINATGIILHTNLGRAPLAEAAIQRVTQVARTSNVELNLHTGKRNHRGDYCVELLRQLTGCEDALLVNNCAAATMMVLQVIACQREVIIARGQLIEIGGGYRLPDVFTASGAILHEVGTTNRTYVHDYEHAVSAETAAVMRVHHSNFKQTGFVTEPTIRELVEMKRSDDLPVIDDLGSGWLDSTDELQLDEPSVKASVASGADLTLFSGDKLLGGPQCGIILGSGRWIKLLRQSPLMRAMRLDKLTLGALEATLEIHLNGDALSDIPTLRMINESTESIRSRSEKLASLIKSNAEIRVIQCLSQIGGGALPCQQLPSYGISIATAKPNVLADHLRRGATSIQSRVSADSVILDLRTVDASQIDIIADNLRQSFALISGDSDHA